MTKRVDTREWTWVDYVITGVRSIFYLSGIIYFTMIDTNQHNGLIFIWLSLCLIIPHLFWRPGYISYKLYNFAELGVNGSFYIWNIFYLNNELGPSLLFMPALGFGFLATSKSVKYTLPILMLLTLGLLITDEELFNVFMNMFLISMMFGFGYSFNRMLESQAKTRKLLTENQKQYELIQAQNHALEQYSKQIEELTLAKERARMAKELHDTIGHTLTSVIMSMDAIIHLIDLDNHAAKEQLLKVRNYTNKGLNDIRLHIHSMVPAENGSTLTSTFQEITREFSEYTKTKIEIAINGVEHSLPNEIKVTLARCLQESLTNAKRHGDATEVNIYLDFTEDLTLLTIKDNGKGTNNLQLGFGLNAMRDRLEMYQGSLHVLSQEGNGTTIKCTVPKREREYEKSEAVISG